MRDVIELLGVGVPRDDLGWWLHRVCARFEPGQVVAIASRHRGERLALLDAVAGRLVPAEGRVWVGHRPLARKSAPRVRLLVGDADPGARFTEGRSVFWNALAIPGVGAAALLGLLRVPSPSRRIAVRGALEAVGLGARVQDPVSALDADERARLAIARELVREPQHLVIRELDTALPPADTERILVLVRSLSRARRLTALVSVADLLPIRPLVDRIVGLADGLLVLDALAREVSEDRVALRLGGRAG